MEWDGVEGGVESQIFFFSYSEVSANSLIFPSSNLSRWIQLHDSARMIELSRGEIPNPRKSLKGIIKALCINLRFLILDFIPDADNAKLFPPPTDPINLAWRLAFMNFPLETAAPRRCISAKRQNEKKESGSSLLNNGSEYISQWFNLCFPSPKQQSWDIRIILDILFSIRASRSSTWKGFHRRLVFWDFRSSSFFTGSGNFCCVVCCRLLS